MSREELERSLRNAKTDMERDYYREQIDKWDGLENIIQGRKERGVYKQKPKGKLDARSHSHALKDASKGGSGAGGATAPVATAYLYLKESGFIDEQGAVNAILCMVPDYCWVIISLLGAGWWIITYAAKLVEKYNREY